jgi:integrase
LYVGPLKTKESRRTVTIPAFLADELGQHLAVSPRRDGTDSDLVFSRRPVLRCANELRSSLLDARRAASGPSLAPTFHHLRHTSAALAIAEGAHPQGDPSLPRSREHHDDAEPVRHPFPSLDLELAERLNDDRADALAACQRHVDAPEVVDIERRGADQRFYGWALEDSNLRPLACKASALPLS